MLENAPCQEMAGTQQFPIQGLHLFPMHLRSLSKEHAAKERTTRAVQLGSAETAWVSADLKSRRAH